MMDQDDLEVWWSKHSLKKEPCWWGRNLWILCGLLLYSISHCTLFLCLRLAVVFFCCFASFCMATQVLHFTKSTVISSSHNWFWKRWTEPWCISMVYTIPPLKLTVRPWKVTFPLGKARLPTITFQGLLLLVSGMALPYSMGSCLEPSRANHHIIKAQMKSRWCPAPMSGPRPKCPWQHPWGHSRRGLEAISRLTCGLGFRVEVMSKWAMDDHFPY